MAVYMQGSRRRWVTIAVPVVALVIGIGVGYVIGDSNATTAGDVVAASNSKGEDAATALQRLPIEYVQAITNDAGESTATIQQALDEATTLLDVAFVASPWLTPALRQPSLDAIDRLKADVSAQVPADQFQNDVDAATDEIGKIFVIET